MTDPATPPAESMAAVVTHCAPILKSSGFRKRRHSFNRALPSDLVHVVDFQMGPFDPPGTEYVPPFRVNLYGRFTINLGVYVPEIARRLDSSRNGWVNEYDCHMRQRIGAVMPDRVDTWWPLDDPPRAAEAAADALEGHGLPWLDDYRDHDAITAAYLRDQREHLGMAPAAGLHVGLMLLERGDHATGSSVLREYIRQPLNSAHREYVVELLTRQGLQELLHPGSAD